MTFVAGLIATPLSFVTNKKKRFEFISKRFFIYKDVEKENYYTVISIIIQTGV